MVVTMAQEGTVESRRRFRLRGRRLGDRLGIVSGVLRIQLVALILLMRNTAVGGDDDARGIWGTQGDRINVDKRCSG